MWVSGKGKVLCSLELTALNADGCAVRIDTLIAFTLLLQAGMIS